jgi:hypothetical protein
VKERLFVAVMGQQNAGKSTTWNSLFGRTVRTGQHARHLELRPGECVEVFLISGSFEERKLYGPDVLGTQNASIILCSVQYVKQVQTTLDFALDNGFEVHVQWLNPGYSDAGEFDKLGLVPVLLSRDATVSIRDGRLSPAERVQEIRELIYGWALYRNLIIRC